MSAKDNAAVIQLFDLLESRYALRVIWALSDGHPQTFRLLQDSVGGVTPNTLNTRIKELRAAHLLDHSGKGYKLTPHGAELARSLGDLRTFASRWHQRNLLNARDGAATPRNALRPPA
ncbi:winged helix-turn-helix transcriptional regulator [Hydrogenophaga laconesensis]|uniref:DNA-binding HxlR family transcriptional regulator n=1 Tax=Hydrogenophaga laconesensis TaxID=1805971 RepID=A0ABU1V9D2_9BURK|nr:winged helix-turn-helix transcriptional regulator [Hydrogenophaga laconesensis]MDR7094047.1 DNA-binding HxlR family transcriptional regulator [Hydrogenophaga laconesensis]